MRRRSARRTLDGSLPEESHTPVRTFLIADIRGYTRFTEEYGDEASARLAARFSDLVREGVELRGGTLIELRGDEALAVFDSARQAIRSAADLQHRFTEETDPDSDLPLRVGIGIDSGEAIKLDDGSFRGAALNVAARLCALAHGGEILVTEGTSHLAGRLPGLRFIDRGRAHLKGIADPVRLIRVAAEEEEQPQRWIFMVFGRPGRLGWRVGLGVVVIAAATAAGVVYLTSGSSGEPSSGATLNSTPTETATTTPAGSGPTGEAPARDVKALIPASLGRTCIEQPVPDIGAVATAVCLPPPDGTGFYPDRWQVSIYPSGAGVRAAYEAERQRQKLGRNTGKCNSLSWGGEGAWVHGPGKPGGRRLCYFDGDDAVIVWSHERLGQPNHRDVLGVAREGGSDHVRLIGWWTFAHHLIGKTG
ncbi:MAG: adenylate/guanylate cyclase domain-containing protein [Gaiellaceae bacterium]